MLYRHGLIAALFLVLITGTGPALAEEGQKPVRVRIIADAGSQAGAPALFDAEIVKDGPADLVWNPADKTLLTGGGEIAAENIDENRLQDAVNKWRTVAYIEALSKTFPLKIEALPQATHYIVGETVGFKSDPLEYSNIVALNLSSAGEVQILYPRPEDKTHLSKGSRYEFKARVSGPLGADHLVVIASEAPLRNLLSKLRSASSADLPILFKDALSGTHYQIGIQALYAARTRPEL